MTRQPTFNRKTMLFHTTSHWNVAFITMVCASALPEAKVVMCSSCSCSLAMSQANFICTTSWCLHDIWHDSPPLPIISFGPKTCCNLICPSTAQAWSMLKGYCKVVHRVKGKIELALWINRNFQLSGFWIKIRGLKRLWDKLVKSAVWKNV